MNWIMLIIAGLFKVEFATCLGNTKRSAGTAALSWYTCFIICLIISMLLLIRATQTLPMGTAYAVWTGIGAFGAVLVGIVVFKESAEFWRLFFPVTLIASVIGLKVVSTQ